MKKVFSILLSAVLMISMLSAASVSAEIKFKDAQTFYEEFINADGVPCIRYYKTIGGVIYSCIANPDYGVYDAAVIAIIPTEKNAKVEILDELYFASEDETVKVTSIDIESCLNLNSNIEEIIVGDNIISINGLNSMFSLKRVILGKKVSVISNSFNSCQNIESIVGKDKDCPYVVENGELYKLSGKDKILISVFKPVNSYLVKSGVTHFSAPFGKDYNLKTLTVNEDLETLKTGELTKLTTLNIGENVKKLGSVDISGTKLKSIDFSGITVESIKAEKVKSLTCVTLPENCKIVECAFAGCKKLAKITISNIKKAPKIQKGTFKNTKKGIKFYVKNKKTAKSLKKQLKNSGVRKAKIYVGKKLVYKNVK